MIELPIKMASLDIEDSQSTTVQSLESNNSPINKESSVAVSRVLRKRLHGQYQSHELSKRRCSLRPKKLNVLQETDDTRGYFVSKKFRSISIKALPTIYEEPKVQKNGTVIHIGASKLRRLNFNIISKDKIRKRKAKVKKIITHKSPRKGRLTMEAFLARLNGLMNTTPASSSSCTNSSIKSPLNNCEME